MESKMAAVFAMFSWSCLYSHIKHNSVFYRSRSMITQKLRQFCLLNNIENDLRKFFFCWYLTVSPKLTRDFKPGYHLPTCGTLYPGYGVPLPSWITTNSASGRQPQERLSCANCPTTKTSTLAMWYQLHLILVTISTTMMLFIQVHFLTT